MDDPVSKKMYLYCSLDVEFHTYLLVSQLNVLFRSLLILVCLTDQFERAVLKLLSTIVDLSISSHSSINCHLIYFKAMLLGEFLLVMTMYSYSTITLIGMSYSSLSLMVLHLILFHQILILLFQLSFGSICLRYIFFHLFFISLTKFFSFTTLLLTKCCPILCSVSNLSPSVFWLMS